MRLDGKVIIVTGATMGVGEAIARRCLDEGARVLVHGLEPDLANAVAAHAPGRASACIADLAAPDAADRVVAAALAAFGRIDGLCNNAAALQRGDLAGTDAELFDRVMAVNVRAPVLLIRAAADELRRTRGCVVNIGSINAYGGEPGLLAYSASKGALMTVSRNLADALAEDGVRVNHLNLDWVLTAAEQRRKVDDGLAEDWAQRLPRSVSPSGRLLAPDEVAVAAVHWLSDESRPFSGSVVDLGQRPFLRNPPKEW